LVGEVGDWEGDAKETALRQRLFMKRRVRGGQKKEKHSEKLTNTLRGKKKGLGRTVDIGEKRNYGKGKTHRKRRAKEGCCQEMHC